MVHKYGILLDEGKGDIDKFQVVAIPRVDMLCVITKLSDKKYTDKIGQSEKVPIDWANGWSVEWYEESDKNECRTAIKNAMDVYNSKHDIKVNIEQLIF